MRNILIGTAALALAACSNTTTTTDAEPAAANVALADDGTAMRNTTTPTMPTAGGALAALKTADGKDVGTVTVSNARTGLAFTVDGRMMAPGTYGIHVHTVGKCEGPKFESAGAHWNPTQKQHGKDNPAGPHQGDLPNLTIGAGGTGTVSFTVADATIGGANGLIDADGAAFMVHAKADDYRTDPSGNSGDRIACGVFTAR